MNSNQSAQPPTVVPSRTLTVDFLVGLFALAGVICAGWLSVGLGDIQILGSDTYSIDAEFDNISGL